MTFLPDAPVFCRGILAGGGMKTVSLPWLASRGAERFFAALFEATSRVAKESGRWAELDGLSAHAPTLAGNAGAAAMSAFPCGRSTIGGVAEGDDRCTEPDGTQAKASVSASGASTPYW
jgi:hypothetical protein